MNCKEFGGKELRSILRYNNSNCLDIPRKTKTNSIAFLWVKI